MPDRPSSRRGSLAIADGVRVGWGRPAAFDRDRALGLLGAAERARAAGLAARRPPRPVPPRADAAARPRRGRGRHAGRAGRGRRPRASAAALEHGRPRLRWPDAAGPAPVGRPRVVRRAGGRRARPAGRRGRGRRGAAAGGRVPRRGGGTARRDRPTCSAARAARAIRRWVRAEAVLKADGRGLRVEPAHVRFDGDRARLPDRADEFRLVDRRIDGLPRQRRRREPPAPPVTGPGGRQRRQLRVVEPRLEERCEVATACARRRASMKSAVVAVAVPCGPPPSPAARRRTRRRRARVAARAGSARRACRGGRRTCWPGRGRRSGGRRAGARAARGAAGRAGPPWPGPRHPTTATRRSSRSPR